MAISASSYGVGNRVYRGGSSAPTRGRVDPMGYIDRELNKPSGSRSGIAAAALRRMGSPSSSPQASGGGQQSLNTSSGPVKGLGGPSAGGVSDSMPGRMMNSQAISVNPVGKLQVPKLAAEGGTGLPFDPEAADAQERALAQKNRFESDFTQAQSALERQWNDSIRGLEAERPENERRLLEGYAGRGLAYSSGYSYDIGDLQRQYANLRGELDAGKTQGLEDLLRQRGLFNDEYASLLEAIQKAAARKAAQQAAELELGVSPGNAGAPQAGQQQPNVGGMPAPAPTGGHLVADPQVGRGSVNLSGPGRNISPNYSNPSPNLLTPEAPNLSYSAYTQAQNNNPLSIIGTNPYDQVPPAPKPAPIAPAPAPKPPVSAANSTAGISPAVLAILNSGQLSGTKPAPAPAPKPAPKPAPRPSTPAAKAAPGRRR